MNFSIVLTTFTALHITINLESQCESRRCSRLYILTERTQYVHRAALTWISKRCYVGKASIAMAIAVEQGSVSVSKKE